mmetsp:Transcript_25498/g.85658  ORF Transcript_25498/g.85658 Transcript_25498/m.85658 type:complete len:242 (-) Transcript_25498:54-779(-)
MARAVQTRCFVRSANALVLRFAKSRQARNTFRPRPKSRSLRNCLELKDLAVTDLHAPKTRRWPSDKYRLRNARARLDVAVTSRQAKRTRSAFETRRCSLSMAALSRPQRFRSAKRLFSVERTAAQRRIRACTNVAAKAYLARAACLASATARIRFGSSFAYAQSPRRTATSPSSGQSASDRLPARIARSAAAGVNADETHQSASRRSSAKSRPALAAAFATAASSAVTAAAANCDCMAPPE